MFINRETDYAIRIVRNLHHEDLSQIESIVQKENISLTMAHKVCRQLKKKDIINSKSGVNGGYHLNKPLEDISLFDVYGAMNDVVAINDCLIDVENCPFAKSDICKVHHELNRVQAILLEELKSKSIAELI